jgi:hypothetical protein
MIEENANHVESNCRKNFIFFIYDNLEKGISYFFNVIDVQNGPDIVIYPLRFESKKIIFNISCKKLKDEIKDLHLHLSDFEKFFNDKENFREILLSGCSESIANGLKKISIENEPISKINFIN